MLAPGSVFRWPMTHICTTIDIHALPDRVWAVHEIEHWSEWTPTVLGVQLLRPGTLMAAGHWIEGSANGHRATLSLDFSGPLGSLWTRLTRGLNGRYLAMEAQGLKRHAKAGVRSQPSKDSGMGGSR